MSVQTENLFSQQTLLPKPDHIVMLIMENHGYDQIIGSPAAPHINALANDNNSALFTQSFAIEHPSQPNYLDLFAGCNQGVTDDAKPTDIPYTTDNLGKELIDAGRTFATYSEGLPSVGYNGASYGNYARKHNPAANWMGTGTNQIPLETNQPLTTFPTDFSLLPTVCFVVPNLKDDMHDGGDPAGIIMGDTWVYQNLTSYIQWAKTHNSLLILTFDEDELTQSNQVATIFTGQMVKAGKYSETIDHYSILRTIEDMYGLPYACNASTSQPISDIWTPSSGVTRPGSDSRENAFSVYPNPANGERTIHLETSAAGKFRIVEIFDIRGKKIFQENISKALTEEIRLPHLSSGNYLVKLSGEKIESTQKLTIK
ncbi:MAG: alkaline phosphatase family protein [Candidatus Kapaibacterium sp.]